MYSLKFANKNIYNKKTKFFLNNLKKYYNKKLNYQIYKKLLIF